MQRALRKQWILLLLALVLFTHIVDFMVLMPLGPKLMELFQIQTHQFSFLVSAYAFSAGICGLIGASLFDRIDRKKALIYSYFGFLMGTLLCALAQNYFMLLLGRALSGMFGGLLSGIAYAIVGDLYAPEERGFAMGKLMASFSLASVLGVPLALALSNQFGWHAPFFAIVMVGGLIWIAAIQLMPEFKGHIQKKAPHSALAPLLQHFNDSNAKMALLMTFLMILSQFVVIPFISPYLVTNTGYPEEKLPILYLFGGLLTAFSGPAVGKWCDRISARAVWTRTGLLFIAPVFVITHLGITPIYLSLIATTLFFGFSNARMVPGMTLISSAIPPERRGSFMSLNSSLQQMATGIASVISGAVVQSSQAGGELTGFSYTAYLSAFFGLLAYIIGRKIRTIS